MKAKYSLYFSYYTNYAILNTNELLRQMLNCPTYISRVMLALAILNFVEFEVYDNIKSKKLPILINILNNEIIVQERKKLDYVTKYKIPFKGKRDLYNIFFNNINSFIEKWEHQ